MSNVALITGRLTPANSKFLYNAAAELSKRELEALLPRVAPDGSLVEAEENIIVNIKLTLPAAEMLDQVVAILSTNKDLVPQGKAVEKALDTFLEKYDPERKAQRAKKRAEKRASLQAQALKKVQENVRHDRAHPQSIKVDLAQLSEAGLELGSQKLVTSPDKPSETRQPIPAAIKHEVMLRDGGQCTWVSADGRRCDARKHLQFDHIKMVCEGGENSEPNTRLLCGPHNRHEARSRLGEITSAGGP